jgi:hypothetical protein
MVSPVFSQRLYNAHMFGLLAILGQLALPVVLLVQRAWVFDDTALDSSNSTNASSTTATPPEGETRASPTEQSGQSDTLEALEQALAFDDQSYLIPSARALPPGAFPQLDVDLYGEPYSGATDWAVRSADPSIDAPTRLTDAFARRTPAEPGADHAYDLLINAIVNDNNGLTIPNLSAAAADSLAQSQHFFKAAVLTEVDLQLMSTTTAQIQWYGAMAEGASGFYYPLSLTLTDRAGFEDSFALQVPILMGDLDA